MIRVGLGYDVHPFGDDGLLVMGGVEIPDAPALVGHSDADVVAHAVADSLLGPTGLPDLGELFPASDPAYAGASSIGLLADVAQRVAAAGWWIGNVDVAIAAEQPRLGPHVAAMVANVTEALRPAREPMGSGIHVAIRPKRGEGVGFVGRREGIACWAVALLEKG
ncbi:MAG: 2-C-methyl-D-erythritol 2,4-cyclodiphosphate synthase [Acidimicrobiia bacterium]|nr:2-C-methyl-D-erythritol 2,4-cyclodiphosphate synthase [Acidimicrobiia bacterium]